MLRPFLPGSPEDLPVPLRSRGVCCPCGFPDSGTAPPVLARCNAKLFKVMFRGLLVQFHGLFVSLQADQRLHLDCLPLVERIQFGSNRSQFLQLIELLVFQKILTYFFQCIGIYFFQLRALRLYPLFLAESARNSPVSQLQCFDHLIIAALSRLSLSCLPDLF